MNRAEDDDDSDIDTDEIKGQLKTMQDALQRHFGHHKVTKVIVLSGLDVEFFMRRRYSHTNLNKLKQKDLYH